MIFAAPWVLLAIAALPLLWWLLRVTPPAPRSEHFPAIRLLTGLRSTEETSARTPWWLLALSMLVLLAGTEIRVRVEDKLLASHFGDRFRAYRQSVPAYIPFLR